MAEALSPGCTRSHATIRNEWRSHVEAHAQSGFSAREYCRLHGLRARSFYRWRRVLAGWTGAGAEACGDHRSGGVVFAEVRVRDGGGALERADVDRGSRLEVVARGGLVVRVWPGFDETTLARVLAVVERCGC
jgi:hypothetical protein